MNDPSNNATKLPTITITITDPMTFDLRLEGHNLPSVDYALNMLLQAVREREAERAESGNIEMSEDWSQVVFEPPTITMTVVRPRTFGLRIEDYNLPSIDYALNMLHQAVRVWEAERMKAVQLDMMREANKPQVDGPRIVRPS